jgi:hypothetical protein
VDIRQNRNFTGSVRESDLPILPLVSQGQHNLGRGKGQYLHHVSEGEKDQGDCRNAINSLTDSGTPVETIPEVKQENTAKTFGRR